MKKIIMIIMIIMISMITAILFVGCKSKEASEAKPPASSAKLMAPTVVGEVLDVKESGKAILVKSTSDNAKGEIWITIDDKTNFFENVSEGTSIPYQNVSHKFAVGNHVEIFIEGGVKESYPMQGTATAVYVNEAKK